MIASATIADGSTALRNRGVRIWSRVLAGSRDRKEASEALPANE
jgi:hypothetical protein